MLIRKNTKTFKSILDIVWNCQGRADREKLIRLYITRAGQSLENRISVEGIQGDAALFYEMNYQTVLNNLQSPNHQLHVSDEIPGIYFFHSTSNKVWDETPFEFDDAIKKEFSELPELPVTRKKEKPEKFVFPTGKSHATAPEKSEDTSAKKTKAAPKKTVAAVVREKGPKQPNYKLKHEIHFTDLKKVIFREPQITKEEVLDYYNDVAEYLLPYLKDRPLWARQSDKAQSVSELTIEGLFSGQSEEPPDWIQSTIVSIGKEKKKVLLCNNKEHLLLYVEKGFLEFNVGHARTKSFQTPDYIVLVIDSPEYELTKAIEAALGIKQILDGLQLPSLIKTDGMSGFHIYIPLDSRSKFPICEEIAGYICKLVRLKIPDIVTLNQSEEHVYGKVSLDYSLNTEGKSVVAPYSLIPGDSPIVAVPLLWDEVKEGLRSEDFNHETIFKRLKKEGDPFETLFKKKINADTLLERLEKNYAFLVN